MNFRAMVMGLLFAVMWSSAFTSARIIVADAPPLTALAVRFALSGAVAVAIALWLGQSFRLSKGQWRATVIFGICQNAIYLGLNFVAMQWVEASVAAIVASSMPLLVAFLGWVVLKERLNPLSAFGLVAGAAGVAIIMVSRISGAGIDLTGLAMCILGSFGLAVATIAVRSAVGGGNMMMIVGLQMWIGGAAVGVVGLATEPFVVSWSWELIAAFVYTTLVPGVAATWIWFRLVEQIGSVRASVFHFLNPFLGVAIAAALLGERFGRADIVGVFVITAAIIAVQMAKTNVSPAAVNDVKVKP